MKAELVGPVIDIHAGIEHARLAPEVADIELYLRTEMEIPGLWSEAGDKIDEAIDQEFGLANLQAPPRSEPIKR